MIVPVRGVEVVLAATLYVTVPLPVPLPPLVMVIHAALELPNHEQLALTVTLPVVAAEDTRSTETGEIVTEHPAAA